MPVNFGNYAQRRIHDATQDRGARMRNMVSTQASQPRVGGGGGGGDRRNRATANASAGSVTYGDIGPNTTLDINADAGRAVARGGSGGGGRKPVDFATYASQREPLRAPAPTHDVPGYSAAVDGWRGTVNQAFDARNAQHRQAAAEHNERMRQYNDAVRSAATLGAPNAAGYGSRPGDKTNSGPGGGRDKAKAATPPGGTPPPPGVRPPVTTLPLPGQAGGGQGGQQGGRGGQGGRRNTMNGYPDPNDIHNSVDAVLNNPTVASGIFGANSPATGAMQTFMMDPGAGGMNFQQWVQNNPQILDLLRRAGLA